MPLDGLDELFPCLWGLREIELAAHSQDRPAPISPDLHIHGWGDYLDLCRSRRVAAIVRRVTPKLNSLISLVLATTALVACSKSPPPTTVPPPTEPPPALLDSRVVEVEGDLTPEARAHIPSEAGAVVEAWFDNAFLVGPYPRASFPDAFRTFSAGAAALAAQHVAVLTNAALATEMDGLRAEIKETWFSVFARGGEPHGATGAVVLQAVGHHMTAGDVTIRVTGDLHLTRGPSGWQIVGFRILNEATTPEGTTTVTASTR